MGTMEHFAVVQSLCRIGLVGDQKRFRQQVERLANRLDKVGDQADAEILRRLLEAEQKSQSLQPSRIELSNDAFSGERLTSGVIVPHDRETSAPLAEIVMDPGTLTPQPILPDDLDAAITALLSEWENYSALRLLGVAPSRSCLIFGAPGTGKTVTALHIARRLKLPVVVARLDGMISSFLGTTARNIGALFEFANRYQCVLLLDVFDALAKLRDDPQEVGEIKRVVNTLLQSLDARAERGITIAITNHPSLLDRAIWRRFEVKIEMPLPGDAERSELIRQFAEPLKIDEEGLNLLAWASKSYTGSDIRSMMNAIKRFAALKQEREGSSVFDGAAILEALRRYTITSADLVERSNSGAFSDQKLLAKSLLSDSAGKFTQSDVAHLLGKDQGTISRWNRGEPG